MADHICEWSDIDGTGSQICDHCSTFRDKPVMNERTLHAIYRDDGDVFVQGFLKFTKSELIDISNAVLLVASGRPDNYAPIGRGANGTMECDANDS